MDIRGNKIKRVTIEDGKLMSLKIDVEHIEYIDCNNWNLMLCDTFFNNKWESGRTVTIS